MSIILGVSAISGTRMQIPTSPVAITRRNNLSTFFNSNPSQAQIDTKEELLAELDLQLSQSNFVKYIQNLQAKSNKESAQQAQAQNIKNRVCKYV